MSRKHKRQIRRAVAALQTTRSEFDPDYTTIKRDLRRIGVLAGTFMVILIVLSLFQDQLLALFMK